MIMMTLGSVTSGIISAAIADLGRNIINNDAAHLGIGLLTDKFITGFQFSINSASYNELIESYSWRWVEQGLIGQGSNVQYTGKPQHRIVLNGRIAPFFRAVGIQQIERLTALGNETRPLTLTSGFGSVFGEWVILSISATNSHFIHGNIPRYTEFTMELMHYNSEDY